MVLCAVCVCFFGGRGGGGGTAGGVLGWFEFRVCRVFAQQPPLFLPGRDLGNR